jgi:hypothetical protein
MSGDGLIDAVWIGSAGRSLSDGTGLEPGVTVVRIPAGEAETSDDWKPVAAKVTTGANDDKGGEK